MTRTHEHVNPTQSDEDVAYLRAALKPYDPAALPQYPIQERPSSNFEGLTSSRRRAGVLVAAAAAVVAVAVVPIVIVNRSSVPAQQHFNAAQALADCNQHVESAGSASTPANSSEPDPDVNWSAVKALNWYNAAKAAQLSESLRNALPEKACVFTGSGMGDLEFGYGPGMKISSFAGGGTVAPSADGRLVTANGEGTLMVGVYPAPSGPDSCVVGDVDRQITTPDGSIVNQTDTAAWDETTRWNVMVVQAYRPDGSCVWLRVSDEVLRQDTDPGGQGMTATGATPLTLDQLTAIAIAPGLSSAG